MPPRAALKLGICMLALLAAGVFAVRFPENYPEHTLALERKVTAFFEQVTLPIKLARLSTLPPDAALRMPVFGAKTANVSDTWHAARGADRQHEGQDIFAAKGTPVFSATTGYVRRTGVSELGGNYVFVAGAGGRRYYYAHFNSVAQGLHAGQAVTTDTVLGFVGNTGNAVTTPPHLHFGMYEGREALNPLPLLIDR